MKMFLAGSVLATSLAPISAKIVTRIESSVFEGKDLNIKGVNFRGNGNPFKPTLEIGTETIDLDFKIRGFDASQKRRKIRIFMPNVDGDQKAVLRISGGDVPANSPQEYPLIILDDPNNTAPSDFTLADANLQNQIDGLDGSLASLQDALNALQTALNGQGGTVNNINQTVNNLTDTINNINGDITNLGDNITKVGNDQKATDELLKELKGEFGTTIIDIDGQGPNASVSAKGKNFIRVTDSVFVFGEGKNNDYLAKITDGIEGKRVIIKPSGANGIFTFKVYFYDLIDAGSGSNTASAANGNSKARGKDTQAESFVFNASNSATGTDGLLAPKNSIVMETTAFNTILGRRSLAGLFSPNPTSPNNNGQLGPVSGNVTPSPAGGNVNAYCAPLNFELIYDGFYWHFVNESDLLLTSLASGFACGDVNEVEGSLPPPTRVPVEETPLGN